MAEDPPQRILIVDDREQNRYILSRVLRQAGYECEQAASGHEAIERARLLPALVILDVHLPDLSGYEVCRQIKSDPLTSHVPVLQISASFVSAEDKVKALEGGADGYLTHPIDGVVLIATVRSLLRLRVAEGVARESSIQWQSTFDALSEGLAFVDRGGRLARFNEAFLHFCGKNRCATGDDAHTVLRSVLGTDDPLHDQGVARYSSEFLVGGRSVRATVDRVRVGDSEIGKIVVLTDITDSRLAEYALRTAEKLAATGKLAHAIAHEINNPLEALVNLIYLASAANQIEDVKLYLERANDEIARISRITKQSLSFHRNTQYAVPLDVGSLVEDVVGLYSKLATTRQVRLVYERKPTLGIQGFPGQLSQVFGNLIRNATEAAPPGSEVVVRVRPGQRGGREGAVVTVHDRGPGIAESVQKQIFDPFFTTKELKGSGLGLWVSRTLVLRHHGTIRFRTCIRNGASGTTFQVFLPVGALDQVALDPIAG